nr:hypothetical protein GCM10025730_13260 [Promicromonospora thailandica]
MHAVAEGSVDAPPLPRRDDDRHGEQREADAVAPVVRFQFLSSLLSCAPLTRAPLSRVPPGLVLRRPRPGSRRSPTAWAMPIHSPRTARTGQGGRDGADAARGAGRAVPRREADRLDAAALGLALFAPCPDPFPELRRADVRVAMMSPP